MQITKTPTESEAFTFYQYLFDLANVDANLNTLCNRPKLLYREI